MKKEELISTPIKADNNLEIKALLEKNLEIAQKNLEVSEGILVCATAVKRYIFWKKFSAIVIWTFIILSTVVSLFYVPTLIKDLQNQMTTVTPGLIGF